MCGIAGFAQLSLAEAEARRLLAAMTGQLAHRGRDALRAWAEPDALEAHKVEPLDFRVVGSKVLVQQQHKARGAESGIDVEAVAWTVWTFDDDGLVRRAEAFLVEDEALEAVGLRE